MKPRIKLAGSVTPDGAPMALYEHDGAYSISFKARIEAVGYRVGVIPAKVHERAKRAAYVIYVADV